MIELEKYIAGHSEKGYGYEFFVPEMINSEWSWKSPIISKLLEKAAYKLGELNSFARLPDPGSRSQSIRPRAPRCPASDRPL